MHNREYFQEIITNASKPLLESHEPLTRLAGEFAMVQPIQEQTTWTETGYHSFNKDHYAERKFVIGRNLAITSFQVVMAGTYDDAAIELMLKHDHKGTRFFQREADLGYQNGLPRLVDEVKATRQFMAEIENRTLKPLIK